MDSLESELDRARDLEVGELADAIEAIGFECTRCGACCRGAADDEHTATVFPDEVRAIAEGAADDATAKGDSGRSGGRGAADRTPPGAYDWRDVARPMPFGLATDEVGEPSGETFEWALQVDDCGDCTFYEELGPDEPSACTVYRDRPLICRTYPFSVDLGGTEPMGAVVDRAGPVRAHECEGLDRDIDRGEAEDLARTLKARTVREVEELMAVRAAHEPADPEPGEVVVHDSEGAKRPDGSKYS